MDRRTYSVDVTRTQRWWSIYVPAIDYHTQARTVAEVEEMTRDLIAGATDTDADAFDLDVRITKPDDVAAHLDAAAELERQGQEAIARAAAARREAAHLLHEGHHLSVIDTARVLGVTRARAYQLLKDRPDAAGDEAA